MLLCRCARRIGSPKCGATILPVNLPKRRSAKPVSFTIYGRNTNPKSIAMTLLPLINSKLIKLPRGKIGYFFGVCVESGCLLQDKRVGACSFHRFEGVADLLGVRFKNLNLYLHRFGG